MIRCLGLEPVVWGPAGQPQRCDGGRAIGPQDRILNVLPLHHVHGVINVVSCALWSGATLEMHAKFDAAAVWQSAINCDA